jgi:hypothetical protein
MKNMSVIYRVGKESNSYRGLNFISWKDRSNRWETCNIYAEWERDGMQPGVSMPSITKTQSTNSKKTDEIKRYSRSFYVSGSISSAIIKRQTEPSIFESGRANFISSQRYMRIGAPVSSYCSSLERRALENQCQYESIRQAVLSLENTYRPTVCFHD